MDLSMVDERTAESNELDILDRRQEEIWEVIRTLVLGKVDAGQVLELYYWSQDPKILAMLRTIVCLPEEHQHTIGNFFSKFDPKSISIMVDASGRVILSSQEMTGHKESQ